MEKRTNFDFSNHVHRVEIFKSEENEIRIDHFQVNRNSTYYIQFINTDRTLTVTGDFGNWVFCRPFHPSADGYVSDYYWIEKLKTYSEQIAENYDGDETAKEIQKLIDTGLEDYGYEGDELIQAKEWYTDLLQYTDDKIDYEYHAYRYYDKPDFIDYEEIPYCEKINKRLLIIFDAFNEICFRLKNVIK